MLRTSRSLSRASTGLRSNQRISSPCCLHRRSRSSTDEREAPLADAVGGALQVRESRCATFPGASGSAGARTAARWCRSAPAVPESPPAAASFENRNAGSSGTRAAPPRAAGARRKLEVGALIEEPAGVALEYRGEQAQQRRGGHTLAALDHAQVRHRGRHAPHRAGCSAPRVPRASGRWRLRSARSLAPRKWPLRSSSGICRTARVERSL